MNQRGTKQIWNKSTCIKQFSIFLIKNMLCHLYDLPIRTNFLDATNQTETILGCHAIFNFLSNKRKF
jgi:hypothetical protein